MLTKNYNFGQLVELLCVIGQVAPDSRSTFVSRIMQLQRLGFPDGVNVGHGKRMRYSFVEIYKLAIAFEILATGVTPRISLNAIRENWEIIFESIENFFDKNSNEKCPNFPEKVIVMRPSCSDFAVCTGLIFQTVELPNLISVILKSSENRDRGCLVVIRIYTIFRRIEGYLIGQNSVAGELLR